MILALDYMCRSNKLYMICTIVNIPKIPYDVGYVTFKLVDQASSYLFWKKGWGKEIEPVRSLQSTSSPTPRAD
jgi:hypothetical protein